MSDHLLSTNDRNRRDVKLRFLYKAIVLLLPPLKTGRKNEFEVKMINRL